MKKYYICRGNWRYDFVFYSIYEACEMCREIGGDCVISAETGEILVQKD